MRKVVQGNTVPGKKIAQLGFAEIEARACVENAPAATDFGSPSRLMLGSRKKYILYDADGKSLRVA